MHKIPTIFERDWEGNHAVIDKYIIHPSFMAESKATEKIDGMNVRLTVRNFTIVRLEKRRNPDKIQKAKGITDPWYVDATEGDPQDKFLWAAARNTDLTIMLDGEWSGEAVGPNIQGNPLNLEKNIVMIFTLNQAPLFNNVPNDYEGLKAWLPLQESKYGKGKIEGIVWHHPSGRMAKIKTKDFKGSLNR